MRAVRPVSDARSAPLALLTGAAVWGLVWYPYRFLQGQGLPAEAASTLTYAIGFVATLVVFRGRLATIRPGVPLLLIGFAAAWSNVAFLVAVVRGEVVRVTLLFYLAPLWTILLSRWLLGERLQAAGALVMASALAGAVIMLWNPGRGLPMPAGLADWLALTAGMAFALSNVLIRREHGIAIPVKTVAVFAGCVVLGAGFCLFAPGALAGLASLPATGWLLAVLLGLQLVVVNVVIQHGLVHTAANRAVVLYLFELVVAAGSAWLLAGETFGLAETVGGSLIVAAAVAAARLEARQRPAGEG